ncbi:MAG: glycosyltransferase family 2 protein [Candidatus Micrarchaeota archaeon]
MISIVLPTFNEAENLPGFFSSLVRSKYDDYEVLVVDGRSKDDTVGIAERFGARIIMEKKPGVGVARNTGLKTAKGELVASLDADSLLCDSWLDRVVWNFTKHPNLQALSGPSYYGSMLYDTWSTTTQWQNNFSPITGFAYLGANNSVYNTGYFRSVGGWSETLDEEMELSLRLFHKRAKVRYDWDLKVKLSDRRFRERGFFRTVFGWSVDALEAVIGHRRDRSGYSDWRR